MQTRLPCQRQASAMIVARSDRSGAQPSVSRALFASATKIEGSPAAAAHRAGKFAAGDASNHVDHLPDRSAMTVAEIDRDGVAAAKQIHKCRHMRAGEILDPTRQNHCAEVLLGRFCPEPTL